MNEKIANLQRELDEARAKCDLRLRRQREAENQLYQVRQERDRQVGEIMKLKAIVGQVREALIIAE